MVTGGGWPELGFKTGPTAGQDALPSQGALSHCVHTFGWDSVDAPVHPMCTALGWGGNWSPQRKPTQTWGEWANSTHTVVLAGNLLFFFIKVITTQCYWRTPLGLQIPESSPGLLLFKASRCSVRCEQYCSSGQPSPSLSSCSPTPQKGGERCMGKVLDIEDHLVLGWLCSDSSFCRTLYMVAVEAGEKGRERKREKLK